MDESYSILTWKPVTEIKKDIKDNHLLKPQC